MKRVNMYMIQILTLVAWLLWGCGSRPEFVFLGEAEGREENFNVNVEVTTDNIEKLYQKYDVFSLFDGEYYLVKSKKSYTNSRYFSRLIKMRGGKQVVARTFYDNNLEIDNIQKINNCIVIGLNSLDFNYYNPTSHGCKVIVLDEDLSPVVGRAFSSTQGHSYVESLVLCSGNAFICSIAAGRLNGNSYSQYQFVAQSDFNIVDSVMVVNRGDYQIITSFLDVSRPDWGNDLSDEELLALKNRETNEEASLLNDSVQEPVNAKGTLKEFSQETDSFDSVSEKRNRQSRIPSDFVLVPSGHLTCKNYYEDEKHSVDVDSFYICIYELTQGEYKRVMGDLKKENCLWLLQVSWYVDKGPQYIEVRGDSIPLRGSYYDFVKYCNARSVQEGYDGFYEINGDTVNVLADGNGYRLVTPYEWIYAAYGGNLNKKEKYLGGQSLSEVAWHLGNSKNKPHPVGLKKPNIIGIYDMQGNAQEILQGDKNRKIYGSMCGGYNVSNWNYSQAYDPTYIWGSDNLGSLLTWCYGTRIALIPRGISNKDLYLQYKY